MLYFIPGVKQLFDAIKFPVFKPEATRFFADTITQTVRHRIDTKTRRVSQFSKLFRILLFVYN